MLDRADLARRTMSMPHTHLAFLDEAAWNAPQCLARSVGQQRVEVMALPDPCLLVELERRLVGEERLGVELAPAVLDPDVVDLMQHLVEHDPRHEEPRDERAIESDGSGSGD